jgi:hypothetical protein
MQTDGSLCFLNSNISPSMTALDLYMLGSLLFQLLQIDFLCKYIDPNALNTVLPLFPSHRCMLQLHVDLLLILSLLLVHNLLHLFL